MASASRYSGMSACARRRGLAASSRGFLAFWTAVKRALDSVGCRPDSEARREFIASVSSGAMVAFASVFMTSSAFIGRCGAQSDSLAERDVCWK